MFFGEV